MRYQLGGNSIWSSQLLQFKVAQAGDSRCDNILPVGYGGHLALCAHLGGHHALTEGGEWKVDEGIGDGGGVGIEGLDVMSSESAKCVCVMGVGLQNGRPRCGDSGRRRRQPAVYLFEKRKLSDLGSSSLSSKNSGWGELKRRLRMDKVKGRSRVCALGEVTAGHKFKSVRTTPNES